MVRSGGWKLNYYRGLQPELFRMEEDPGETNDLAGSTRHRDVERRLTELALTDWNPDDIAARMQRRSEELSLIGTWERAARRRSPIRRGSPGSSRTGSTPAPPVPALTSHTARETIGRPDRQDGEPPTGTRTIVIAGRAGTGMRGAAATSVAPPAAVSAAAPARAPRRNCASTPASTSCCSSRSPTCWSIAITRSCCRR